MSKPSAGERNQQALGAQSIGEYLDIFAPIERTVANDLLSTAGNQVEAGRTKAATGMAWNAAIQPQQAANLATVGPASGAFVARTLDMSRQRGSAQGMAQAQIAQDQAGERTGKLTAGMKLGRGMQRISTGAMRSSDLTAHSDLMEQQRLREEKQARRFGMAGEVVGAGLGAYAQYKGAPKVSGGDYYTQNGKTYWNDGTLADNGMSYAR